MGNRRNISDASQKTTVERNEASKDPWSGKFLFLIEKKAIHFTVSQLNYLGFPGAEDHLRFDSQGRVWVPHQNYIPIPVLQLMDKLFEVLDLEGVLKFTLLRLIDDNFPSQGKGDSRILGSFFEGIGVVLLSSECQL